MSSWGPAISSNDTYADIYGAFFELYDEGMNVTEISEKLISKNHETIADKHDCHNFWFALAKAQWECKELDEAVFNKVKEIVTSGADNEVWKELGADIKDIQKRKKLLDKFLIDLQTEKSKPRNRKKKKIIQSPFDKGDCITFILPNGNYGGAVIIEVETNSSYAFCLVVTTRINQPTKPTKKDFEEAEVLCLNYGNWNNKPCVRWYHPVHHKKVASLLEKVASIDCKIQYSTKTNNNYGFIGDFEIWVIDPILKQFESEKENLAQKSKLKIKDLTGTQKSKWKFW